MRDYLDAILSFIGAESLTDEEFESIDLEDTDDQVANYNSLVEVLRARDLVSDMISRLRYYFLAQGVAVSEPVTATSNIFVGAELC